MKPAELISKRESLINSIKTNWNRIELFNTVTKGVTRDFDIIALYEQIKKDSIELVKTKVAIQAINMGLKSLEELPENSLYPAIYMLQQIKEQKVKLLRIKTSGSDVIITRKKQEQLLKELDIESVKLADTIDKFNKENDFKM